MKKLFYYIVSLFLFTACEDVIDVDLESIAPRLVVQGDIEWEKGTSGAEQRIRLSQSTDFFNESIVPVTNAQVVMNQLNSSNSYTFTHEENGWYTIDDFIPVIDAEYELLITANGQNYRATEQLKSVTDVERVEQTTALSFDGEDEVSIDFFTLDPPNVNNYYLVTYVLNEDPPFIFPADDNFLDGNEIPFIYRQSFVDDEEELLPEDVLNIEFEGISEAYYNFMFILTEQAFGGFGPFSTTPVGLKGNVVNLTNQEENAFGFFRLSEKVTFDVVVE